MLQLSEYRSLGVRCACASRVKLTMHLVVVASNVERANEYVSYIGPSYYDRITYLQNFFTRLNDIVCTADVVLRYNFSSRLFFLLLTRFSNSFH